MRWIRQHFMALVVLVAIVVSFFVAQHDSIERDKAQSDALVAGCVQSGTGRALLSAWQSDAADARRAEGDVEVANDYVAYANATAASLAIAKLIDDPKRATQAVKVHTENGPQFVLTQEAAALVARGCEAQYRD